ncbi:retrovirus-related pol polyprotein from transposon TNT 1-94 [Tanacetum coccineum]
MEIKTLPNNSQGKKQIKDHRRNFKFSNNKTFVAACNDSLNAKTLNVNFVCVTYGKCVLNDNHDMCVLHYINGVNSRTRQLIVVPISTREHTQTVNQSVATSSKKTVATNSTVKKPRNIIRKIYEQVNLYSITLQDTTSPNPICLMAKATSSQAWLWHGRLSHLNIDTINLLSKYNIVTGLPKLNSSKIIFVLLVSWGKGDACLFVGYSTQSRAYRVFNKRTRVIFETIHVNFDELPQMVSDHVISDPIPQCTTTVLERDSLCPDPQSQENVHQAAEIITTSNELDLLFSPMFDALLNGTTLVVSMSSVVYAADAPDKRQHHNTTHTFITTIVANPPPLNIHTTPQTTNQAPT